MLKERKLVITPDTLDSIIRDYHWMVNAIKKMREEMVIGAKTAQYGIEATLPRAAGSVRDPIQFELNRRFRHLRRIKDYEHKILEVQQRLDKVVNCRDAEILFWLLEGKSMRWIGKHMNLSHTNIQLIRKNIIRNMIS